MDASNEISFISSRAINFNGTQDSICYSLYTWDKTTCQRQTIGLVCRAETGDDSASACRAYIFSPTGRAPYMANTIPVWEFCPFLCLPVICEIAEIILCPSCPLPPLPLTPPPPPQDFVLFASLFFANWTGFSAEQWGWDTHDEHLVFCTQANGALKCSDVLAAWEPVREAVGSTPAAMSAWCSVSVQPVIDAYNGALVSAGHSNISVSRRKSVGETSSICRLTGTESSPQLLTLPFKILTC